MKLIGHVTLFLGILFLGFSVQAIQKPESRLMAFCRTAPSDETWERDGAWVKKVCDWNDFYCSMFKVKDSSWTATIMLKESHLNPNAEGPDGEVGLGQCGHTIRTDYGKYFERIGLKCTGAEYQVAMTCAYYRDLLQENGSYEEAARAYNGAGPQARAYAEKVRALRKRVFGTQEPRKAKRKKLSRKALKVRKKKR